MENKIKVGIIGAGGRANFQAKSIFASGIGEPTIVYSPFEDEVRKFAQQYGIQYTTSLQEVLSNKEISAITISTPNATHFEISKQGLLHGKNILVEYPPTLNIQEIDELISIAEQKGLVYWVSLTQLLENPYYTIKKNIKDIGEIIFSSYSFISSYLGGWYADPGLCGPLYTWQHFHFVSQILDVQDDVESVYAFENIKYSDDGKMVSTSSIMTLKFISGGISTIEFAMGIKNTRDFKMEFVGDNGMFYFNENKLCYADKKTGKKEISLEETNLGVDTADFLKRILQKQVSVETATKARKILNVCLCADISAKEGRIVKMQKI